MFNLNIMKLAYNFVLNYPCMTFLFLDFLFYANIVILSSENMLKQSIICKILQPTKPLVRKKKKIILSPFAGLPLFS